MEQFLGLLASTKGRIARIVVGSLLVILGLFVVNGSSIVQVLLVVVGLVPLLAGAFDVCLFAALNKLPFKGADLRKALTK
ncbi:MAG TPA: DUF2892 domain-containing protein [Thermoflexales bacterium]|jgi:hypothetical protein|nr:DUF2892 domain-containing protein [Thermoflexales bacterium]